jgi:hypothetical protein
MDGTDTSVARRPIDQLVAGLCESNVALRERCRALEELATSRGDDAASYQLVAKQAIEAFHREHGAHTRLRERYERLVVEHRELLKQASLRRAA